MTRQNTNYLIATIATSALLVTLATRHRPHPAATRTRCTHVPPVSAYAAVDLPHPAAPPPSPAEPLFAWCCDLWQLTSGGEHSSYCHTAWNA
ncbi:hypothetical protein AB0H73_15025 [Streptomyces olivoreticuli]